MTSEPLSKLSVLSRALEGELLTDRLSRLLYATDASPHQKMPLAVARPKHRDDCVTLMRFAAQERLPLIPRAAGTSLAGQCVGEGVVIDFTRHMNRILAIDPVQRRARVQPGVIRDDLNDALSPFGLMFAPDPSTSNRCTIGGMFGNNAWGSHALRYGTTRDHGLSVEAVLSDGSIARFESLGGEQLREKLALDNLEGRIYRAVYQAIDRHRALILDRFPRPDGIPRNAGYPLDVLARGQPWESRGPPFNLARLLCGSEGTLALVGEIEVGLVPLPARRRLVCVQFDSLPQALSAVAVTLNHKPSALELVDRHILELTKTNLEQQRNRFWIEGDPAAVLLIDFVNETGGEVDATVSNLMAELRSRNLGYARKVLDSPLRERALALRAAGLGLLMGMPGPVKAVTGIEDTAVSVKDLPAYAEAVFSVMARHGVDCVVFGPAGWGVLHFRPLLDLRSREGRRLYERIVEEVFERAIRFGGTISAKHGDGRLRSPYLEGLLGGELYVLLHGIKAAFDPHDLLNPHKIFDPPPLVSDLRAHENGKPVAAYFDWSREAGLRIAASKCNGAGACLKSAGRGTMCPSYMATREEKHGTRGRANVFRQVMDSPEPWTAMDRELLREVLDLCLACKGCKSECPANVDMARMKAEFLQQHYDRAGVPWRARIVGNFDRLSRIASFAPALSNAVLARPWLKSRLGFHPERPLPPLAAAPFSLWLKQRRPAEPAGQQEEVLLFNDPFTEYYEPQLAIAALEVLERLGFRMAATPCLESGRIQISQGLLSAARKRLSRAVERLYPSAVTGRWIIGLEPSEILTFRDEAADLLEGEELRKKARIVADRTLTFEEFIVHESGRLGKNPFGDALAGKTLLVHGHCHQKALIGMQPLLKTLSLIPGVEVRPIPSGCCGMAGVFGYEEEHYAVSLDIAELVLFPAIREAGTDALIVALGTSCRRQIADGLGVRAYHPVEVMLMAMGLP
ncbi:FAD-binding and (Fe-S)-binding domain-containing protein [Methylocaldum sp. RMAD-M]|jgi:FAD/FMN-containing dehydrogenase/Fe-S oxidoreductase|uniref:FAD-binding and (Fe-S)-binding domain-containing protein n=1 Tax=Methylocaldum sp. RMAD-M TaxID=2806557 RepID=UPI000A322085|nr:FAD-binding and (Fe-S)-binding domain-containing protein [Methylocaldum sp. RMAD-M]MBP1149376.1 FAD/FMN-containing dehydrogenase/Fe-S oxidoreductase [Methylocaldum sp. RMAD-M]